MCCIFDKGKNKEFSICENGERVPDPELGQKYTATPRLQVQWNGRVCGRVRRRRV